MSFSFAMHIAMGCPAQGLRNILLEFKKPMHGADFISFIDSLTASLWTTCVLGHFLILKW